MKSAVLALLVLAAALAACGQAADSAADSAPSASPEPTASPAAVFTCGPRELPFSDEVNLTGAWLGNDDGIYYLTQLGETVWWNGMHLDGSDESTLGQVWNNVLHGTFNQRDMTISGDWADVPRGVAMNAGHLSLEVADDDGRTVIRLVEQTNLDGDAEPIFGGTFFTPCQETGG